MRSFIPTLADLRLTVRLAAPVAFVQVGMVAMGMVDVIMVGHLSAAALAAVALGNLYFFGATIFGMGVLMALDPIIAQKSIGVRANYRHSFPGSEQRADCDSETLTVGNRGQENILAWLR